MYRFCRCVVHEMATLGPLFPPDQAKHAPVPTTCVRCSFVFVESRASVCCVVYGSQITVRCASWREPRHKAHTVTPSWKYSIMSGGCRRLLAAGCSTWSRLSAELRELMRELLQEKPLLRRSSRIGHRFAHNARLPYSNNDSLEHA